MKKIIGIIFLGIIIFSAMSTTTMAADYDLKIGGTSSGFASIAVEITYLDSSGINPEITEVYWEIKLEGAILLTDREATGLIDEIPTGFTEIIYIKPIFGFGPIYIDVSTGTNEYIHGPIDKTFDGFIIGPFVFIK